MLFYMQRYTWLKEWFQPSSSQTIEKFMVTNLARLINTFNADPTSVYLSVAVAFFYKIPW